MPSKKAGFSIVHGSIILPILDGLNSVGVSPSIINKSQLKKFDLSNEQVYLPILVLEEFANMVKWDQGIDHVAETFYSKMNGSETGDLGTAFRQFPDVLSALINAVKHQDVLQTLIRETIHIEGPLVHYTLTSSNFIDYKNSLNIGVIIQLRIFKTILGEDWNPIRIELPSFCDVNLEGLVCPDVIVQYGFPHCRFSFNTEDLVKKNKVFLKLNMINLNDIDTSKSTTISLILDSMKYETIPKIEDFSAFFNISRATIIRTLKEEGTTFSKLLTRHQFKKSIQLLKNPKITIDEISFSIGYSATSNFIRAFKSWTGITPEMYRQTQF